MLNESRVSSLVTKYTDIIGADAVNYFKDNDPTENNAYLEWMLKIFKNLSDSDKKRLSKLKQENYKSIIVFVKRFHNTKNKFPKEKKDINSYDDIFSLYDQIVDYGKDYSDDAIEDTGDVQIHINNDEWLIFTPLEFDVAEEYGHNNPSVGSSWCVCYESNYFYDYFCPDGGITMIINKFDEKKNLALEKTSEGKVLLWDYKDQSGEIFNLLNYLNPKNHTFKDIFKDPFLVDFFEKQEQYEKWSEEIIEYKDIPTSEDLEDYFIENNDWLDLVNEYNFCDYFDHVKFLEWYKINNDIIDEIDSVFLVDFIEEHGLFDEDDLYMKSDADLIEIIEESGKMDSLISRWYLDNYDSEGEIEDLAVDNYNWDDLDNFMDIDSFLRSLAGDEEGLSRQYYGHW